MDAHLTLLGILAAIEEVRASLHGPCQRRKAFDSPHAWLLESADPLACAMALTRIERDAREIGCPVVVGSWRKHMVRPFGALLGVIDDLVERMLLEDPALVRRYQATIVNLMPCWQEGLRAAGESHETQAGPLKPRPGLQDFVLRGDRTVLHHFFQKRNLAPWTMANLVHFVLESATILAETAQAPLLACLEGVDLADRMTLRTLQVLSRYGQAGEVPLVLCASGRPLSDQASTDLRGEAFGMPSAWMAVPVDLKATTSDVVEAHQATGDAWRALAAASALGAPFSIAAWRHLAPDDIQDRLPDLARTLVSGRLLRRVGSDRFAFQWEAMRRVLEDELAPDQRCYLHRLSLAREQGLDPFFAASHATAAGDRGEIQKTSLAAMEWAWGTSAYECARTYAERAVASAAAECAFDPNLLMAMLCYEAQWYTEAERYFQDLLASGGDRPGGVERTTVEYFLGYNAVFGLGDFKRGEAILRSVLAHYEFQGEGKRREAGYVRNSIAFAMYRSGRLEEAIDLEEVLIDAIRSGRGDTFLLSIANLNLGRLYRNVGVSDRAIGLFKAGMFHPTSELSPYAQLLFYASLGHLHTARAEAAAALQTYHHFLDLMRDLQLDGIREQVLQSLPDKVPRLAMDLSARGDQTRFYIYASLAATCQTLGLSDRAQLYLAGIERLCKVLGSQALEAARRRVAEAPNAQTTDQTRSEREFEQAAQVALQPLAEVVQERAREDRVLAEAAKALVDEKAVAFVCPRRLGAGVTVVDSLVLCDARSAALIRRINLELGAGFLSRASAALALPSAARVFRGLDTVPLLQQDVSIRPESRQQLAGLEPIRIGVQVLHHSLDGSLFKLLASFEGATGVGMLAAIPFHLRLQSMAIDPVKALTSYLASSVDYLVLGSRLLEKTHGATAAENLFPLRPRRSRLAVDLGDRDGTFVVQIVPTWGGRYTPSEYIRLRSEMRSVLSLCDGRMTVAEICQRLSQGHSGVLIEEKVAEFLRTLCFHGVLYFPPDELPQQALA